MSRLLGSSLFKRRIWSRWYTYLEDTVGEQPIWFLNYGYEPQTPPGLKLSVEDEPNRTSIQLYNLVAGAVDLSGKRVLEVSSGRGGGARFVYHYMRPELMVGLDRTAKAVDFCNRHHGRPGLTFVCGDAQQLPHPNAYFHAVLNVEASHCYPDVPKFLREVWRVLKPGGHFLYADLRKAPTVETWCHQIQNAGFKSLAKEDITADVVRALEQSNDRVSTMINTSAPRWARRFFSHFAATKGTGVYTQLQSGSMRYIRHLLIRPES